MTLEELMNKLIKIGRKPRGEETYKPRKRNSKYITYVDNYRVWYYVLFENLQIQREYTKRELVSKESGLWQFVCEKGMVGDGKLKHNWVSQVEWGLDVDCRRKITPSDYAYRLIESSLKDESELEDFLLNNIKIDE